MLKSSIKVIAVVGGFALATTAAAQVNLGGAAQGSLGAGAAGVGAGLGVGANVGAGIQSPNIGPAVRDTTRSVGSTAAGAVQDTTGAAKRMGPVNASPTGAANANANAGLSSATAADLSGLRTGLTVKNTAGATLGTVSKIEKSADGTVRSVHVAGADAKGMLHLAPSTLSLSGDVVTTTSTDAKAH